MRQVTTIELAKILWECETPSVDYTVIFGRPKPHWDDLAEFNQEDYVGQATRLLKVLRIGIMQKEG